MLRLELRGEACEACCEEACSGLGLEAASRERLGSWCWLTSGVWGAAIEPLAAAIAPSVSAGLTSREAGRWSEREGCAVAGRRGTWRPKTVAVVAPQGGLGDEDGEFARCARFLSSRYELEENTASDEAEAEANAPSPSPLNIGRPAMSGLAWMPRDRTALPCRCMLRCTWS